MIKENTVITVSPNLPKNVFGDGNLPPINLDSGDWTDYLPTYEPQRFIYDTDECSQLGGMINPLETYFNWLKSTNQISTAFMSFLTINGYFDSNGSFSFSERFTAILDGTSILGNSPQNAWLCLQKYGAIPRSMLNWTLDDSANYPNQALMDTAYYNPAAIQQNMIDVGKQFLSFIKDIGWGWTGGVSIGNSAVSPSDLQNSLKTSPCAWVVSVTNPVDLWNQIQIPYTNTFGLNHVVTGYKIDPTQQFSQMFTDQYQPFKKAFSSDYPIWVAIAFFIVLS